MGRTGICAECKYFLEPRETGEGWCDGYEKPTTWNEEPRPCVLYGEPRDGAERRRRKVYIERMEAQHAGTENAVDPTPGT
jgi:hypothetical protein